MSQRAAGDDVENGDGVRLNIGAGITYLPGYTNIDLSPKADISMDLSRDRLPFDDNSVDVVFSYHTLEHIPNYLHVLGEIHRVLKDLGRLYIGVPYATDTHNLSNPYHVHYFTESSFRFFDRRKDKGSAVETNKVVFREVFCCTCYKWPFLLLPGFLARIARRYMLNVASRINYGLLAIKREGEDTVPSSASIRREMKREFVACLMSRRHYSESPSLKMPHLRRQILSSPLGPVVKRTWVKLFLFGR